jgi:hypothetical protein
MRAHAQVLQKEATMITSTSKINTTGIGMKLFVSFCPGETMR